jgi:hypothetical protein
VSAEVRHGDRTVGVGGDDGPQVAVAYRLAPVGDQAAVVAAGRDDLAWVGLLAAADRDRSVGVEVAGGEPGPLDGVVERVDVVIRRRHDGDGLAAGVVYEPVASDLFELVVEGAGDDPAVGFVGVERGRVAGA